MVVEVVDQLGIGDEGLDAIPHLGLPGPHPQGRADLPHLEQGLAGGPGGVEVGPEADDSRRPVAVPALGGDGHEDVGAVLGPQPDEMDVHAASPVGAPELDHVAFRVGRRVYW